MRALLYLSPAVRLNVSLASLTCIQYHGALLWCESECDSPPHRSRPLSRYPARRTAAPHTHDGGAALDTHRPDSNAERWSWPRAHPTPQGPRKRALAPHACTHVSVALSYPEPLRSGRGAYRPTTATPAPLTIATRAPAFCTGSPAARNAATPPLRGQRRARAAPQPLQRRQQEA